jgi:hypothetical protein
MYNNDSDRQAGVNMAEQQDTIKRGAATYGVCVLGESHLNSGTTDSADDWSARTNHEQGNLYSESLFLSCP